MTASGRSMWRLAIALGPLAVTLWSEELAAGGPPAAENHPQVSTPAREDRLKECEQLGQDAQELQAKGKIAEAIEAARAKLAIEREVLGAESEAAVGSLALLALLHQLRDDWPAARQAAAEVLELRRKSLGNDHWQTADARWVLADVETWAKLDAEKRRRFRELERQAAELSQAGAQLSEQGAVDRAIDKIRQGLAIRVGLYSQSEFPFGHRALAENLNDLGSLLQDRGDETESRRYYLQAIGMRQALYPKDRYPHGHPQLADSLNSLATLLDDQGNWAEARRFYERALEMFQAVYPVERYPQGQPDLAAVLNNLGILLQNQGNYPEAREYLERALEMRQQLYPRKLHPRGHPLLAQSLNNLGILLQTLGDFEGARAYLQRAHQMKQHLFPKDQYPRGQAVLAMSLNNLGFVLGKLGRFAEGREYQQQALEMRQALYPGKQYPRGHPELAMSLNNLGVLIRDAGHEEEARGYFERALAISQALYSREQYPRGHPTTALFLTNLGGLLQETGAHALAWPVLCKATDMGRDLAEVFLTSASEAEAFDYLAQIPASLSRLMSTSLQLPDSTAATYARVWSSKALIARTLERRQETLVRLAGSDPAVRQTVATWNVRRRELARLLLAPSDGRDQPERMNHLNALTADKERLERDLAARIPQFAREKALEESPYTQLIETLPDRTVVVDAVQYVRYDHDPHTRGTKGERRTLSYVGFVLAKDRPVERVDLGPAQRIDDAVESWRTAIIEQHPGLAAANLRQLTWDPLSKRFPPRTSTVFIAPDGALTAIPWSALPGDRPGSVLLEEYAIALVPHTPYLFDRLTAPARKGSDEATLLALGGVSYDQAPKPVEDEQVRLQMPVSRHADVQRGGGESWKELPGTRKEIASVLGLARDRRVIRLEGAEASTAGLLSQLPKARWAHVATHGFFANPDIPSVLRVDRKLFDASGRNRAAPGARSPLVLSGLVLAGANRPSAPFDPLVHDDFGILTAEAIAGLPLQNLELVVLSACETGLGKVAGGEGVFSLQRAFHLAGAQTVVASLWKVDDDATQALMSEFYTNLWTKKQPRLEALRQAQLALLKDYRPSSTQSRGGKKMKIAPSTKDSPARKPGAEGGATDPNASQALAPFYWAAFVLSGDWR